MYTRKTIEKIKNISIVQFIKQFIPLVQYDNYFIGVCPFCKGHATTLIVSEETQTFFCCDCGFGGDIVTFIMQYMSVTYDVAIKLISKNSNNTQKESISKNIKKKQEEDKLILQINKEATIFYQKNLMKSRKSQEYCVKRELSKDIIQKFHIGCTSYQSLYSVLSKKYSNEDLEKTGLFTFKEDKVYDKFFNRLMIPICNKKGDIIGFGGRILTDDKQSPKYLNSPATLAFNKRENLFGIEYLYNMKSKYVILCEGYMDVISLHQAGFNNAVASLGTAFTKEQAKLLHQYTDIVCICYDSDKAGRTATEKACKILSQEGLQVVVMNLKQEKDPDDFIKQYGKDAFIQKIKTGVNGNLWLLQNAVLKNDIMSNNYQEILLVNLLTSIT